MKKGKFRHLRVIIKELCKSAPTAWRMRPNYRFVPLFLLVLLAAACGGGGSGGGGPSEVAQASISGRLTFDLVPITDDGLNYDNIRRQPIRGVWVEALDAGGAALDRSRSDTNGDYRLSVAPNTQVRIRVSAHMQRTQANEPRWDVKVTDNTRSNALYTLQGELASSGTGASTRNLHAASGWVVPEGGSVGRYANTRAAAPFAILSFTYNALQKLAAVDADMNLPALEYRWSVRNRMASGNFPDGAIGGPFYNSEDKLIYLRGRADENTDEYDQSVVIHEFAHHFTGVMSRDDSMGGSHTLNARLDMRLSFSEGFANTLGAIIADDPIYRDSFGPWQVIVASYNNEENPTNATNLNRIGWYHSYSVAAILYDLYDGTSTADNDSLNLGLGPIYNTLTSDGFKNNRHYTSIYIFAKQLLNHVPASNRTTTRSNLNALLNRHNIAGRGDDGAGETNRGGLRTSARVLPVYKSITAGDTPITLCSVNDAGYPNKLGNRAFVKVTFTENGPHTLTLTSSLIRSIALPYFRLRPYGSVTATTCGDKWPRTGPRSCTFTGNFRADEVAVLEAFEALNINKAIRELLNTTTRDSCFYIFSGKNNAGAARTDLLPPDCGQRSSEGKLAGSHRRQQLHSLLLAIESGLGHQSRHTFRRHAGA